MGIQFLGFEEENEEVSFISSLAWSLFSFRGKIALWTIGCSDDQDIPVWGDREDPLPFSVRRGFNYGIPLSELRGSDGRGSGSRKDG